MTGEVSDAAKMSHGSFKNMAILGRLKAKMKLISGRLCFDCDEQFNPEVFRPLMLTAVNDEQLRDGRYVILKLLEWSYLQRMGNEIITLENGIGIGFD